MCTLRRRQSLTVHLLTPSMESSSKEAAKNGQGRNSKFVGSFRGVSAALKTAFVIRMGSCLAIRGTYRRIRIVLLTGFLRIVLSRTWKWSSNIWWRREAYSSAVSKDTRRASGFHLITSESNWLKNINSTQINKASFLCLNYCSKWPKFWIIITSRIFWWLIRYLATTKITLRASKVWNIGANSRHPWWVTPFCSV